MSTAPFPPQAYAATLAGLGEMTIHRLVALLRDHTPADAFAARDIHFVAAAHIAASVENLHVHGKNLHDGRRKPLSRHSTRHGNPVRTLTLKGRCGVPR